MVVVVWCSTTAINSMIVIISATDIVVVVVVLVGVWGVCQLLVGCRSVCVMWRAVFLVLLVADRGEYLVFRFDGKITVGN